MKSKQLVKTKATSTPQKSEKKFYEMNQIFRYILFAIGYVGSHCFVFLYKLNTLKIAIFLQSLRNQKPVQLSFLGWYATGAAASILPGPLTRLAFILGPRHSLAYLDMAAYECVGSVVVSGEWWCTYSNSIAVFQNSQRSFPNKPNVTKKGNGSIERPFNFLVSGPIRDYTGVCQVWRAECWGSADHWHQHSRGKGMRREDIGDKKEGWTGESKQSSYTRAPHGDITEAWGWRGSRFPPEN